jgi:hypothetical protein
VVRKGKMMKDKRGQMSIDFIAGLSLFMLALLFLAQFIPGMFVPFQTETIDLSSVAYRTSVILVEDPGWWDNGTCNNTDWENQNAENISRIGLAVDREHPNMLDMSKLDVFENETLIDNENLTRKLGLYRNISGTEIEYGYNISIEDNGTIVATRGDPIPEYGDVSSMKRIVWMQTGSIAVMGTGSGPLEGGNKSSKALFYINATDIKKGFLDYGLHMIVTDFNLTGKGPETYDSLKIANNVTYAAGDGYRIKQTHGVVNDVGGYASLSNVTCTYEHEDRISSPGWTIKNGTDTLEIFMPYSLFYNESLHNGLIINGDADMWIELNFGKGIEVKKADKHPPGTSFESILVAAYKPTGLIIKVWQ